MRFRIYRERPCSGIGSRPINGTRRKVPPSSWGCTSPASSCASHPTYERALAEAPAESRGSLFALASPFFFRDRVKLAEAALRNRSMSMVFFREMVEAGDVMSYGPSVTGMYQRVAEYVDRIARGAKPGDLPIEQPTKFEFVLNLKTAKAIGLDIPTAILLHADEVIE